MLFSLYYILKILSLGRRTGREAGKIITGNRLRRIFWRITLSFKEAQPRPLNQNQPQRTHLLVSLVLAQGLRVMPTELQRKLPKKSWNDTAVQVRFMVDFMVDVILIVLGLNSEDTDVLRIWQYIEVAFPRIAVMARDILACAAAGVGVERLFSIARQQASFNQIYSLDTFEARMMIVESCRQENRALQVVYEYDLVGNPDLTLTEAIEELDER